MLKMTERQWDMAWEAMSDSVVKYAKELVETRAETGVSDMFIACCEDLKERIETLYKLGELMDEVEFKDEKEKE